MREPTMADVARAAGVSKALVSIAFRGAPGVSEVTRDRIFVTAQQIGYRANRTASLLKLHRTRHLGVVVNLRSAFHAELAEHLQDAADEAGYEVVLSAVTGRRDERQAVETLLDYRCEAAILLGSELSAAEIDQLAARLLVVSVGRPAVGPVDAVRTDDAYGMEQVVDHLVGLGHRDLAHVDGGTGAIAKERSAGFRAAVGRRRLTRRSVVVRGGNGEADGARAATSLLARAVRPTAVVAYNDACALGVLERLSAAKLAVPGDLSVTGYDDSMVSRLAAVDLTSVSQEAAAQARWAVAAAVGRLEGTRPEPEQQLLSPRLVVRGSTGPAADRG